MKRIALAAATALTLAGSLVSVASAQDYGQYNHQNDNNNRGDSRDNDRNRGDDNRDRRGGWDNRDQRGGWDNNDRRDNDRRGGWDNRGRSYGQFNNSWRRGDRMPYGYQSRYYGVDYRREHLREPPRGYRYIHDDRGETLLVGIATGVILSVILGNVGNY